VNNGVIFDAFVVAGLRQDRPGNPSIAQDFFRMDARVKPAHEDCKWSGQTTAKGADT